jgi:hypothetical protein
MQKKIFFIAVLGLISATTFSQDCTSYYFLQNNKTIEMTIYNKKGEAGGRNVYAVSDVQNNNGAVTATVNSELFNRKGKSSAKGKSEITCNGSNLMVDMKMLLPQEQQEQYASAEAKVDKAYIEYPASMNAGDQLKDANFHMEVDNHGLKSIVTMNLENRKVVGKESVTTPAGTWETYKITFTGKLNVKTIVGINFDISGTEWYAPGFGVVKTESKHGGTAITAIK